MAVVFVSIGSNIDKQANIVSSIRSLTSQFGELTCSSVYLSKAVGFEGDDFYNMVASFETEQSPQAVAQTFERIEKEHGRVKGEDKFVSRQLDLDQILYDDLVDEGLRLPSPDITENAFVLVPLSEIAPSLQHPVSGISYADLLAQRPDWARMLKAVSLNLSAPD